MEVLEKKEFVVIETVDLDPVNEKISNLEVDIIDRIKKVDDKIIPVDLTKVFAEIGKVKEQIAMLPRPIVIDPILASIKALEGLVTELSKQVAIVQKENELQDVLIEEVKESTSNPLGG